LRVLNIYKLLQTNCWIVHSTEDLTWFHSFHVPGSWTFSGWDGVIFYKSYLYRRKCDRIPDEWLSLFQFWFTKNCYSVL